LNQFADLSVCANQNKFHKNSVLVSDLRIYLFTFNLGGESRESLQMRTCSQALYPTTSLS
jgi:hypothetical protein